MSLSPQKIILTSILLLIIFFAIPQDANAQTNQSKSSWVSSVLNGQELIPEGCRIGRQARGSCGINEIIQLLINITRLMFGVMGSAALLMFTYGGFLWIISMGKGHEVEKAKGIILNSIYGIAIILCAWVIVNFVVLALSGGKIGSIGQIFGQDWNDPSKLFK